MLWSGDKAWRQSGERRMLCGLQLPGPNNQQLAFKGKVADVDQSKVWPAGTCLGIDPSTNQPTDIPVDCAAPHAMEVTGAVNLAEKFPTDLPPEPDQDSFIKDACTRMTDAYLAPIELRSTTLTLIYSTISLPSWSAGSHQVSCSIGATLGNGGWSTLLNSAKAALMINGQPPIAPPDIPEDRLNLPPIPVIEPQMPDSSSQSSGSQASDQGQQTQHMPGQHSAGPTGTTGTSTAPTPAPPPGGNTFLGGPPPPGAPQDGPPPPDGAPPQGPGAPPGPAAPPPDTGPALGPPPGEPLPPPPPGQ
jgi:predicted heme/steroid binding protein